MIPGHDKTKAERAIRIEERSRIAAFLREKAQALSWVAKTILENAAEEITDGEHWKPRS